MRNSLRLALCVAAIVSTARAAPDASLPLALRGVDPDKLSGGLFAALDAQGFFAAGATPPRAAASYGDLSKGRPPAVLDARVGANVRLGDDPDPLPATQRGQAEPHIYRSAINPNLLLACFQEGRFFDGGALDCGYSISRDGGLTWTRALIPQLTASSGGPYLRATDPVAAIGPQGDLYLNTLAAVQGVFTLAANVVTRSTDGGATWTSSVIFQSTTAQIMPDKNWLAVNDYPAAPNSGRLVATWTNFTSTANGTATGNNILAAVSDDRGATWSAPIAVTAASSDNQGSQPVFLPDGSLALVYTVFVNSTSQLNLVCKRSLDGGRTYSANESTIAAGVVGWDDPEMRDGVFLPSAAAARTTGELFVAYTALAGGTPRILVAKSSDGGATWMPSVVASDNPAGRSVMNPAVAVSPDGKTVSVVFMDKRLAPNGLGFVDHFAAISTDGGATWRPNIRLTEMSSDIRYGPQTSRGAMLGDYLGVAPALSNDDACVAVWCDTRTGDSDPFTVRFTPAATQTFETWAIARLSADARAPQADADADGVPNALEFKLGTNPRRAESGETFVLRKNTAGTLDVLWAERQVDSGFPVATAVNFPSSGIVSSPTAGVPLASDQLPAVTVSENLHWVGARYTDASGVFVVGHTLKFSGGIPPFVYGERATAGTDARLINVASRGQVKPGAPLIAGFVLEGNKTMLVRGAGPALTALGVGGAIADPQLQLQALASDIDLTNDNWQQGASFLATRELFARLGAFPFAASSADAALTLPLGPQNYTALLSNRTSAPGVALIEAYDADAAPGVPGNPRLLNLSTRADVGTGENALVAGFVLRGTQPRRVLIRAVGPTLASSFSVSGALTDPQLALYNSAQAIVATNDDWEISRSGAAIAATAQRVGAFPLTAASLDSALLITLEPGSYTVVVTGVAGVTGGALVEIYDAD